MAAACPCCEATKTGVLPKLLDCCAPQRSLGSTILKEKRRRRWEWQSGCRLSCFNS